MLMELLRRSWPLTLFASIAGAVSGAAGAMLIGMIGRAATGGVKLEWSQAWSFAGLSLLTFGARMVSDVTLLHLGQATVLRLRMELSRQLLGTPFAVLQRIGKAELLAILTNDIGTVAAAYQTLPVAFCHVVMIAACCVYLAWLSPTLFCIFLAMFLVSLALYKWAEAGPLRYAVPIRMAVDTLYQRLRGLVEGSRELKLNSLRGTAFVEEELHAAAQSYRELNLRSGRGYAMVGNLGSLLYYGMLGVILLVAPHWTPLSAQTLATYALVMLYLIGPISHLMGIVPSLRQASVSLARVELLGKEIVPTASNPAPSVGTKPVRIGLQRVRHRYVPQPEAGEFVLGPIDLEIVPNEVLFITGGNGSGKTTLAMLILGLYVPAEGAVTWNGIAVGVADLPRYRNQFSVVFSDFYLFDRVHPRCAEQGIPRADTLLRRFGLAHKVSLSNNRFSTLDLSSGQRRRLALVAACVEDRPVFLFDEWASDQDPAFRKTFYAEVLPELKAAGKTVIVISHDDSYFACADRVVRLRDGQLEELDPYVEQADV